MTKVVEKETKNFAGLSDALDSAPSVMGLEYLSEGLSDDFKWYILHVLSGFEAKVQQSLKERITTHKMLEHFAQIYVPQEQVTVNVAGKKKSMKKKFFPGYILIKMKMSEASWHLVQNTDKVTGFVGGEKGKPIPIADEEAQAMLVQATGGFKKAKSGAHFSQGDSVKVIEGPFTSFVGMVEEVNDKGRLKVQVSIFGRPTPVELDFTQVEKV